MKSFSIAGLLVAFLGIGTSLSYAQAPKHEQYVHFKEKLNFVEQYPNWSVEKPFLVPEKEEDEEFYISRVRKKSRFVNVNTQVDPKMDAARKLLWWCPIGISTWNGLPSYRFDSEVFSMWSYVDHYGNWTAPLMRMPASFMDACHKNGVGTSVLGGVPWAERVYEGDGSWGDLLTTICNQGPEKLLKYLRYYGIDGIGLNSEFDASPALTSNMKTFFSTAFEKKNEIWPDFSNVWYAWMNNSGGVGCALALDRGNSDWFQWEGKQTSDYFFLNYGWGQSGLQSSQALAEEYGRSSYDVYGGFNYESAAPGAWPELKNSKISVGLWGAHDMNLMFEDRGLLGANDKTKQNTYQLISENSFSGSTFNPVNPPAIRRNLSHSPTATDSHGIASFITARSPLVSDNLEKEPFVTYFNLGNGLFFNVNGQRQFAGEWYNIGIQDYLPTWRWWWTSNFMGREDADVPEKGLKAEFTWDDAWFGGSCLSISGETNTEYLQLFKTEYALKTSDKFTIRYKVLSGKGDLYWSYCEKENETRARANKIASLAVEDNQWVENTLEVGSSIKDIRMDGKTLAMLGLRFNNTSSDFKILIGEISITRGESAMPASPQIVTGKSLKSTYNSLDFKVVYKMKDSQNAMPVYNDEVGAWHYKIYSQQKGEKSVMCTATTSWAAYVVGAPLNYDGEHQFRIGVSAVSLDGKKESEIAWSEYMELPEMTVVEGVFVDKPVIKPNESFVLGFNDPNHAPAEWSIYRAEDDVQVGKTLTGVNVTASLPEIGIYNVRYVHNGETVNNNGMVQISGEEVGAMPRITELKVNGKGDVVSTNLGEPVTYTYLGRAADGYVSRGLDLKEKAFGLKVEQLGFTDRSAFTFSFWFNPTRYNHGKEGTNFFCIRNPHDGWSASDWGYMWFDIQPDKTYLSLRTNSDADAKLQIGDKVDFTANQWHHVALVFDYDGGRYVAIYVNGKKVGEIKGVSNIYDWSQNNRIMIGGAAANRAGLDGVIDEVQLYNKALTDKEVKESMLHQNSIPASLIGYWDFETNADETHLMASTGSNPALKASILDQLGGKGEDKFIPAPANFVAGAPFIQGTNYKVETLPTWKFAESATITQQEGNTTAGQAKVDYASLGEYEATLTLSNSWGSDTKTFPFVKIGVTGIEDNAVSDFNVYPNPFVEELHIQFAETGNYTIQVYSMNSMLISQQAVAANAGSFVKVTVNADSGVYFVKVLDSNQKILRTIKVIKK